MTVAIRPPLHSSSVTIGRGGPRRASRATSATDVAGVEWGVSATTGAAGGNESQSTPAGAAVKGEDSGSPTYQSPGWPFVGHNSPAFLDPPLNARACAGSPIAITSRAFTAALVRTLVATGASVAPSRQRPASVSTNTFTGTRATSPSVRARKRVSQSGGDAKITAAGSRLTSTTN